MENTQTVSKVSVALGDTEIKIIEELEKKQGSNFSVALRVIVREWDEIKNSEIPAPTKKSSRKTNPRMRAVAA